MFILLILHGSNFIEQQSGTVVVWNRQNADRSLQKWIYCVVVIIFGAFVLCAVESSRVGVAMWTSHCAALRCAVASSARAGGGLGEKLVVGAVGCDGRRHWRRCVQMYNTHTCCSRWRLPSARRILITTAAASASVLTNWTDSSTLLGPCTWPPSDARVNTFIDARPELSVWVQFHQTALGNCYGLKLAKCWLQFWNKNK